MIALSWFCVCHGARYDKKVRDNRFVQAFLSGASVITVFTIDVAKVALGVMTGGVLSAVAKGLWPSS